jgi:cation diffusion facilitator family transporter
MKPVNVRELPPERQPVLRKAIRLEVVTIAYLVSVVVLMYLVMGSSQAMKSAWLEDLLSLLPPIAFLAATPFRDRPATEKFPYGFHRAVSIAFLVASVALLGMGLFLFFDSAMKLIRAERPTIGTVTLFGEVIWLGWLMIPVLLWSVIPAFFLGRAKGQPARVLHNKVLYADGEMNKADWLTGVAAMVGVLGIAIGWWWADAVAAIVISCDITWDGFKNVRACVFDLIDRMPQTVDDRAGEAIPTRLATELKKLDWVVDAEVRLRECGQVFFGEAFVRPKDRRHLMARLEEARQVARSLDWRLQEVVIELVGDVVEEEKKL